MNLSPTITVVVAWLVITIAKTQAQTSDVCLGIDCQQGTCVPLGNTSYPSNILSPYQCLCKPGWQTVEGLLKNLPNVLTLPCTIPNCTLNLGCNGSSAPTVQASPTMQNVSSPCSLPGICGNGGCEVTDMNKYPPTYKCTCAAGYANVGNLAAGYCLKDCEIGSNCRAIGVSLPPTNAGSRQAIDVSGIWVTLYVLAGSCPALFL
ncbi:uncharacterized protein [Physcomitrium patens]|uniref:EGF-like domain-containing protein n=1 Tax=Physcomitrium patens TaxID=3218 RepID=A0A2K1JLA8_PHYPA|nr:uncharacterized protein LOC112290418 [Physcomitrium patens]XP_024392382.1 uncharacterized protein LOC112290418 [Physcomitrium patens]XP_024392383.1 uncharacterized protein LOC112290418 [Physcomitrium patens]PNR42299.1 hypothetical protein PHYPA_017128 [Physcomitrium patens]|eukprot:XP_024392381.1 uncharacterized protein LOC112290418 [Physcomitrella patens]